MHTKVGGWTFILLLVLGVFLGSCDQIESYLAKQKRHVPHKTPHVEPMPEIVDQVFLKTGGVIEGEIVSENEKGIRIRWSGGVVGFKRSEISRINHQVSRDEAVTQSGLYIPKFKSAEDIVRMWPKKFDHLVFLKNGSWMGGTIKSIDSENLKLERKPPEGGKVEVTLKLDDIEKIELWPYPKTSARSRLAEFRAVFPHLTPIDHGHYHVLTSEEKSINLERHLQTIEQLYHDWLIHFFPLIRLDQIPPPLDVVALRKRDEFEAILKDVGYVGKNKPIAFYHFEAKKFVFYNASIEQLAQDALANKRMFGDHVKSVGAKSTEVERRVNDVEERELKLIADAKAQIVRTIRHEAAHQLFDVLGVLPGNVYEGGWLTEGLATYSETQPIGAPHVERLMLLRYADEEKLILPLEHLLKFGRAAFQQLDPLYADIAYAESWAFVYFLMSGSDHDNFFAFLIEISKQGADYDSSGERVLLEKKLGVDLKTIEPEFQAFLKQQIRENVTEDTYSEYREELIRAGASTAAPVNSQRGK